MHSLPNPKPSYGETSLTLSLSREKFIDLFSYLEKLRLHIKEDEIQESIMILMSELVNQLSIRQQAELIAYLLDQKDFSCTIDEESKSTHQLFKIPDGLDLKLKSKRAVIDGIDGNYFYRKKPTKGES